MVKTLLEQITTEVRRNLGACITSKHFSQQEIEDIKDTILNAFEVHHLARILWKHGASELFQVSEAFNFTDYACEALLIIDSGTVEILGRSYQHYNRKTLNPIPTSSIPLEGTLWSLLVDPDGEINLIYIRVPDPNNPEDEF